MDIANGIDVLEIGVILLTVGFLFLWIYLKKQKYNQDPD
jgi:hypothetical protein